MPNIFEKIITQIERGNIFFIFCYHKKKMDTHACMRLNQF